MDKFPHGQACAQKIITFYQVFLLFHLVLFFTYVAVMEKLVWELEIHSAGVCRC